MSAMNNAVLKNVVAQEKTPKPTLNAAPGLGAWLAEVGGSATR